MVHDSPAQPSFNQDQPSIADANKTREQLLQELTRLRQRLTELTTLEQPELEQPESEQGSTRAPILLSTAQSSPQEQFIASIAHTIRQSLDIQQMLDTTVAEVRRFLQVDRVVVYRFHADWQGEIVAESVSDPALSLLHRVIRDDCFNDSMAQPYQQGRIHRVNDTATANLDPCYVKLLTELNVQAVLIIPILVRQELWGLLAAHQCTSSRQWQELNWLLLQQLSIQLGIGIHQAELYQRTQQQAEREQVLNQVIQEIRNSLELDTIFATATTAIGRLLQVSRVEILQYLPPEKVWVNVASYRHSPHLADSVGVRIPDENNQLALRLRQGKVVQIADYQQEADAVNQAFAVNYPGSWLLVPLEVGGRVWGGLGFNQEQQSKRWSEDEIELAGAIANQLAVAIQQSQLYQAIQRLNNQLEDQVRLRTAQLQQSLEFEALLKRITDKVRDSLDEQWILQTTVEELSLGLTLLGCDTALYDLYQQTATIRSEYLTEQLPSAQGRVVHMPDAPDLYAQLLQGQTTQFCHSRTFNNLLHQPQHNFTILACPMIDNRQVIGDMWLLKPPDTTFNPLEIRLAQQVANQCAIALRQSRLYQAAQAQVRELERLNRLKDSFLSTVSHELRTPMSNIKMATRMLEMLLFKESGKQSDGGDRPSPLTDPRLPRYFQILQDECQREINLITDLLDLAQLEAEAEPLTLSVIDLSTWIPSLMPLFEERTQQQQQVLQLELPANLPLITTDRRYLERIMTELLTNACKYTPPGERIIVSVQVQSAPSAPPNFANPSHFDRSFLLLQVTNYGIEIPASEHDRIFQTFYRIPNTDPWRYGGTGLGLALVKKLVDRLQGEIQLESRLGRTCFTIQLPL